MFSNLGGSVTKSKKIRVMIAKPGLDGHDRGAKYISRVLRDAGMEVIYTGIRQTPEQIVNAAIQEDVDILGLSLLSGAHNFLFPKISEMIQQKVGNEILLFGGGVIPEEDIDFLKTKGFKAIFTPGTSAQEVIDFIKSNIG